MSDLARTTQRLAVLLAAGVAPASAWRHAGVISDDPVADLRAGPPTERGLAAAWTVATAAGAPLAPALSRFAECLRDLEESEREARVALAGPVATTRIVMLLPVVGLGFGALLGFDTLRVLFTTVPGLACLVVGVILLLIARRWNHRLVAAARPPDALPGLELELLAIAVTGGGSLEAARLAVSTALDDGDLPVADVGEEVLELSRAAGVPARALLVAEAEEARRDAGADARQAAAELAVRLMLPLGLCVLPAFLLLAVAPMVIALVSSTVSGF